MALALPIDCTLLDTGMCLLFSAFEPAQSSVKFSDIGGCDDTVEQVCKLLVHMRHPEVFRTLGVTPPRGFLLHGPPGCGKTLLAHAIAGSEGEEKSPLVESVGNLTSMLSPITEIEPR